MKKSIPNFLILTIFLVTEIQAQSPLFPNSVVSNDIDFILETDPDVFMELSFIGLDDKEMPDSQSDVLFDEDTFIFETSFSTGESIEIWCHSSFGTQELAEEYAEKLGPRLGKLPSIHREYLDHVVIHNGNATAFAEEQANFFVLYSENMDNRISTNDLEETVFHESVHASYQLMYVATPEWLNAQSMDVTFVTEYAQNFPEREDMAESALFAYTFITHPGRLSEDVENWLMENIPNRIEFFRGIYQSTTSTLDSKADEIDFNVFPNPTSNKVSVIVNTTDGDEFIKVVNTSGDLVKQIKMVHGVNTIELGELSNGVYFIYLSESEQVRIIKI